jgi:hypothetical protein
MKKLERLKSMSLLLFVAFLGGTWGAQRAHADTVSEFTGTWDSLIQINDFGHDENPGTVLFNPFSADSSYSFVVINPTTAGTLNTCTSYPCYEGWSGTFVGGTMSFNLTDNYPTPPAFTATITGGSYSGFESCPEFPPCFFDDSQTFTFTGQWANGWTSVGTFSAAFEQDGVEPGSSATLSMTTTAPSAVPEPGGITLMGTGIILVVASLRLRLRNSFPAL